MFGGCTGPRALSSVARFWPLPAAHLLLHAASGGAGAAHEGQVLHDQLAGLRLARPAFPADLQSPAVRRLSLTPSRSCTDCCNLSSDATPPAAVGMLYAAHHTGSTAHVQGRTCIHHCGCHSSHLSTEEAVAQKAQAASTLGMALLARQVLAGEGQAPGSLLWLAFSRCIWWKAIARPLARSRHAASTALNLPQLPTLWRGRGAAHQDALALVLALHLAEGHVGNGVHVWRQLPQRPAPIRLHHVLPAAAHARGQAAGSLQQDVWCLERRTLLVWRRYSYTKHRTPSSLYMPALTRSLPCAKPSTVSCLCLPSHCSRHHALAVLTAGSTGDPGLKRALPGCRPACAPVQSWQGCERVDGDQDRAREGVDCVQLVARAQVPQHARLIQVGQRGHVLRAWAGFRAA